MINLILMQWNASFWGKVYVFFFVIFTVFWFFYLIDALINNPYRRLKFIERAEEENCIAIGKLVCAITVGNLKEAQQEVEYLYYVDNKPYYVTYKYDHEKCDIRDTDLSSYNPDSFIWPIKTTVALFYDKKKPKKVFSKLEVFCSSSGIRQVATRKNNIYRDAEKHWVEPIDLRCL